MTWLAHGAVAVAAFALARWLRFPEPGVIGAIIAVVLALPLPWLLSDARVDRERSLCRVRWVERPYFAHWCAAVVSLVGLAVLSVPWFGWAWLGARGSFSLATATGWAYLVGLCLSVWGMFVARYRVKVCRVRVAIDRLGRAFDGYKIVHLSDLHLGSYHPKGQGARWVEVANRERGDLVAITGDLATNARVFSPDVVGVLAELRASDGVVVVPGNHDHRGDVDAVLGQLASVGVHGLRNRSIRLRRGQAALVIAGVDARPGGEVDLGGALAGRRECDPTVLLAHDPDLFPHAARARVDLVLSGHTHGGQVAVPFLARWLNVSWFSRRFRLGVYRRGASTLVVSGGLGTTGPPLRLGVPPEIGVIELHGRETRSA